MGNGCGCCGKSKCCCPTTCAQSTNYHIILQAPAPAPCFAPAPAPCFAPAPSFLAPAPACGGYFGCL